MRAKLQTKDKLCTKWRTGLMIVAFTIPFLLFSINAATSVYHLHMMLAIFIITYLVLRRFAPKAGSFSRGFRPPLITLPTLLFGVWVYIYYIFGYFGLEPILFHLEVGAESPEVTYGILIETLPIIGMILASVAGVWLLIASDRRLQWVDRITFLPLIALNPLVLDGFAYAKDAYSVADVDLVERYADTMQATAPTDRPNILHIYLESTEATLLDRTLFGSTMEPLKPYIEQGVSLENVTQIAHTQWTLAGQVASSCGVPMMSIGIKVTGDVSVTEEGLLPNAICLSDRLAADGYDTTYLTIGTLQFQRKREFVAAHSFSRGIGYELLRGKYPAGGNMFGLDDEDILNETRELVRAKAKADSPYYLSVTTAAGHMPKGYTSRSCVGRPSVEKLGDSTLEAIRCTNELIVEMLTEFETEGLLENTLVVLQSDHWAMRNTIYSDLQKRRRGNLFIAFGLDIEHQVITKPLSIIDVYPTIMELAGYKLVDSGAGLGVSAFAARPSLIEEFGLEHTNVQIRRDKKLRIKLWGLKNKDQRVEPKTQS